MAYTCVKPNCSGDMLTGDMLSDEEEGVDGVLYCSDCFLAVSETDLETGKADNFYG